MMTVRELIEYLQDCPQDNNAQIMIDYEEENKMGWYVDVIEVETVGKDTEIRAFIESEVE